MLQADLDGLLMGVGAQKSVAVLGVDPIDLARASLRLRHFDGKPLARYSSKLSNTVKAHAHSTLRRTSAKVNTPSTIRPRSRRGPSLTLSIIDEYLRQKCACAHNMVSIRRKNHDAKRLHYREDYVNDRF